MSFYEQIEQVRFPAPLPQTLLHVRQKFDTTKINNVADATSDALLTSGLLDRIEKGDSVALGVGSRGISNLVTIVKTTVKLLKNHGAKPFIVPAMGSHGGATPEGQTNVLHNLGVTYESTGAEIRATMEVIQVGQVENDGPIVYQDLFASQADHVLLINRIKAHTSFRSKIESGLAKMAVIGLGKQKGAAAMHAQGVVGLQTCLEPAARICEQHTNLRGGLAIVENALDETADIVALNASDIGNEKEAQLLLKSKSLMAKLPFDKIDVLVVCQLGKKISGTGMDTNVIRRFKIPRQPEPTLGPDIATICVLDVVTETTSQQWGNANGMGLANVISSRLHKKIDWKATYTNALTSGVLGMWKASMPITMADDCRTIQAAVLGCGEPPQDARIVFIKNTLELSEIWTSNLREEIDADASLSVVQDDVPLSFDDKGMMESPWKMT